MASYLDKTGLTTLWSKMKSHVSSNYLSLQGGAVTGNISATSYSGSWSGNTIPISKGGTGATTAANARANLEITPANIGALSLSGGTLTGPLTASTVNVQNTSHAPLTVSRSGSTYYASIKFANSLGTLGYIGMTAVDGALCRGNSTGSNFYALLDASNWSTYCMGKNPAYIEFSPSSTGNCGGYLDFHYNNSSKDYTSRIIENGSGILNINQVCITAGKLYAVNGQYGVPYVTSWNGSTLKLAF